MENKFKCPGRTREGAVPDFWSTQNKCTYCGSMPEDLFFSFLDLGTPVTASRETKTFFFADCNEHFCVHHLSEQGHDKIIKYYEQGKLIVTKIK